MDALNAFALVPTIPEPIIAQVQRQLADEAGRRGEVPGAVLAGVADQAVRDLWDSRVMTFVPVLALRQARVILREQGFGLGFKSEQPTVADRVEESETRPRSDTLSLDHDVLLLDERETMRF